MPSKSPRIMPCCGRVIAAGERCDCQRKADRERGARHDLRRPNAAARGYDASWRTASKIFLRKFPCCARCGAAATAVNHKKPHRGDMGLFWSPTNWEPVCTSCHSGLIQREERRAGYY